MKCFGARLTALCGSAKFGSSWLNPKCTDRDHLRAELVAHGVKSRARAGSRSLVAWADRARGAQKRSNADLVGGETETNIICCADLVGKIK